MQTDFYYSPSTGGFYNDEIHGAPTIEEPDPDWMRPMLAIKDPSWVRPTKKISDPAFVGEGDAPTIEVPDEEAVQPTVDVPDTSAAQPTISVTNIARTVPTDALPVTAAEHAALMQAQVSGKQITAGLGGKPVATDPPPLTEPQQLVANESAIAAALDALAHTRGYDSIKSACAYASPIAFTGTDAVSKAQERFRIEGNALQAYMSSTWAKAYAYAATVAAGKAAMPTTSEAVAMMPVFTWPD